VPQKLGVLDETIPAKRIRLNGLPIEIKQAILARRAEGCSLRGIAADLNLSHGSVQRLLKMEENGGQVSPSLPRIPKRPRNGQHALPDFERIAKLTLKGKTVKDCWQDYARDQPKAYSYEYFSTLFRVWLDENKTAKTPKPKGGKLQTGPEASGLTVKEDDPASHETPVLPKFSTEEFIASRDLWQKRIDPRSSVFVLHGHGCTLKVERGELVAWDGSRTETANRRFPKVTHGLSAVIFLGSSGLVTFEAIKWLEAQGVGLFVLGWYSELISVSQPASSASIEIRRAQFSADRLRVAKAILAEKLSSGARLGKLSPAAHAKATERVKTAKSVDDLLAIEAQAALDYWSNRRFSLKHRRRNWPDQWTEFSYRASPISGGPRHAMHPVNAILNYAYSTAAAYLTRTLAMAGFDPACGFLHADAQGRYSLSYDVLELLRADIDAAILPWVASVTWKRADFPVTPEGVVRLTAPLAGVVAQRTAEVLPQAKLDWAAQWMREAIMSRVR
jgi:CRISPR-associated protein Cas1